MKTYIYADSEIRYPAIVDCTPIYTGGNIYIYWGEFSDGTYFMACDDYWDLRIVNANPLDTYNGDYFEADYPDWQEEHLIKDIPCTDTQSFFDTMYNWILKNKPDNQYTNYNLADMEERKNWNNNESGGKGDRNY